MSPEHFIGDLKAKENGENYWDLAQRFVKAGVRLLTVDKEKILALEDPKTMVEGLTPQVASEYQKKWREDLFKDPKNLDFESNLLPRIRKANDPEWCERNRIEKSLHDGETAFWFDMADPKYAEYKDLPSNYQEETRLGAEGALWAVADFLWKVAEGYHELDLKAYWEMGEDVHRAWIARNPPRNEEDAKRDVYGSFASLSLAEQIKDLAWLTWAAEEMAKVFAGGSKVYWCSLNQS